MTVESNYTIAIATLSDWLKRQFLHCLFNENILNNFFFLSTSSTKAFIVWRSRIVILAEGLYIQVTICYILSFCFRSGKPSFENCCIQNSQFMKWSSKIKAKHFTSREHNKFLEVE